MIKLCHLLVPGSRYHVIAGAGHSAYFEKPAEFNEAVLDFLRAMEPPLSVNGAGAGGEVKYP